MDEAEVDKVLGFAADTRSLSETLGEDSDTELAEVVADPGAASPFDEAAAALMGGEIEKLLASLTGASRRSLRLASVSTGASPVPSTRSAPTSTSRPSGCVKSRRVHVEAPPPVGGPRRSRAARQLRLGSRSRLTLVVAALGAAALGTACGGGGGSKSTTTTSAPSTTLPKPVANIEIRPASGPVGTTFTLIGTGFKPGETVTFQVVFPDPAHPPFAGQPHKTRPTAPCRRRTGRPPGTPTAPTR
jgi:DNA-directed RNA polymerase, sigma subunit (sigma70/sigma32)